MSTSPRLRYPEYPPAAIWRCNCISPIPPSFAKAPGWWPVGPTTAPKARSAMRSAAASGARPFPSPHWRQRPEPGPKTAQSRTHVALHGCKQNTADIGEVFVRNAGYNRWADSNRIVVLYPQTSQKAINSCWDWWGYDAPDYAKKSAPQMSAIAAMVAQLGGGTAMPSKP